MTCSRNAVNSALAASAPSGSNGYVNNALDHRSSASESSAGSPSSRVITSIGRQVREHGTQVDAALRRRTGRRRRGTPAPAARRGTPPCAGLRNVGETTARLRLCSAPCIELSVRPTAGSVVSRVRRRRGEGLLVAQRVAQGLVGEDDPRPLAVAADLDQRRLLAHRGERPCMVGDVVHGDVDLGMRHPWSPHAVAVRPVVAEFIMYPNVDAGAGCGRAADRRGRVAEDEQDPGRLRRGSRRSSTRWRPRPTVAGLRPLDGGKSSLTYLVELERRRADRGEDGATGARRRRATATCCARRGCRTPSCGPGARRSRPVLLHRRRRRRRRSHRSTPWTSSPASRSSRCSTPATSSRRRRRSAAGSSRRHAALGGLALDRARHRGSRPTSPRSRWSTRSSAGPGSSRRSRRPPSRVPGAGRRRCSRSSREPVPSTVVHGEYRLGNLLAQGDDVAAIIDWELWTREDPRVDLSWFLSYLDADEQPSAIRPTPDGMPTRAEFLAAYEDAVGAPGRRPRVVRRARALQDGGDRRGDQQAQPTAGAPGSRAGGAGAGDRPAPRAVAADPRALPDQEVVRALRVDRRHRGDHRGSPPAHPARTGPSTATR